MNMFQIFYIASRFVMILYTDLCLQYSVTLFRLLIYSQVHPAVGWLHIDYMAYLSGYSPIILRVSS